MGGCQNYGPLLGTLNIRCRNKTGTQKGTIVLTIYHIGCKRHGGRLYRSYHMGIEDQSGGFFKGMQGVYEL